MSTRRRLESHSTMASAEALKIARYCSSLARSASSLRRRSSSTVTRAAKILSTDSISSGSAIGRRDTTDISPAGWPRASDSG